VAQLFEFLFELFIGEILSFPGAILLKIIRYQKKSLSDIRSDHNYLSGILSICIYSV